MSYIKLDRRMLNWGWYTDGTVKNLWVHILLKANWSEGEFLGVKIPAGSFATSVSNLSIETGLSDKQVRMALNKLEKTGEITTTRTNRYTIVHVEKWADYQVLDTQEGKQMDTQRCTQTDTQRSTERATIEEDKKIRNKERVYRTTKPTVEDVRSYCQERHNNVDPERFWNYYEANGWKVGKNSMKDWKACVRTWERNTTHSSGRHDIVPTYDEAVNPEYDADRFDEIMRRRNEG